MKKWRNESALDVYNLAAAAVLLAAPWLFSLTNGTARLDFWLSAAAIVAMSLAAMFAYANWEEWIKLWWACGSSSRPGCSDSRMFAPCISA